MTAMTYTPDQFTRKLMADLKLDAKQYLKLAKRHKMLMTDYYRKAEWAYEGIKYLEKSADDKQLDDSK